MSRMSLPTRVVQCIKNNHSPNEKGLENFGFELNRYSRPERFENDFYRDMPIEKYLTLAFMRACKVTVLIQG